MPIQPPGLHHADRSSPARRPPAFSFSCHGSRSPSGNNMLFPGGRPVYPQCVFAMRVPEPSKYCIRLEMLTPEGGKSAPGPCPQVIVPGRSTAPVLQRGGRDMSTRHGKRRCADREKERLKRGRPVSDFKKSRKSVGTSRGAADPGARRARGGSACWRGPRRPPSASGPAGRRREPDGLKGEADPPRR